MFKNRFRIVAIAGLLVLASCRMAPVYNVESSPLGAPADATLAQVTEAISKAGFSLGWQMNPDTPGHMTGTLRLRSHVAVVDITYDTKIFSITYADSSNLKYDGRIIHKNYNSWVQNLSFKIMANASAI